MWRNHMVVLLVLCIIHSLENQVAHHPAQLPSFRKVWNDWGQCLEVNGQCIATEFDHLLKAKDTSDTRYGKGQENPGAIFAYKNCLDLQVKPVNFFQGPAANVTCRFRKLLGCPTSPRYELIMSIKGVKKEVRPQWLDQAMWAVLGAPNRCLFAAFFQRNFQPCP